MNNKPQKLMTGNGPQKKDGKWFTKINRCRIIHKNYWIKNGSQKFNDRRWTTKKGWKMVHKKIWEMVYKN